ncbi:MAG: hypothetical protein IPM06_19805 [Rhizobiales bacterium]|nr:hypothetical protein [Hyphomicrobiales bacterium]
MAVADILVGPINIWYSPVGTALPSINTIAVGASFGAGWVSAGMTLAPLSLSYEADEFELEVEQYPSPVSRARTKEKALIETQLAEFTAANLLLALASTQTVTAVAAGASVHASDTLKFGGDILLPMLQWGFETWALDASSNKLPKRVFIYKATASIGGKLEFSKKAALGIPLKISALVDTAKTAGQQLMEFQIVTGWKTS